MNVAAQAQQAGRQADDSEWMDHAIQVGLVSYGVVHLIMAWLALQLAFGDSGGSASSQGALHEAGDHHARTDLALRRRRRLPGAGDLAGARGGVGPPRRGRRQAGLQAGHLRRQGRALRQPRACPRSRPRLGRLVRKRRHRRHHHQAHADARRPRASCSWSAPAVHRVAGFLVHRGLDGEVPLQARRRGQDRQRRARPTSCSARSATSPRASRSRSSGCCSSTPRSPTTRTSPVASTRRCTRSSSSRSAPRCSS